jgi:hypothetical protein
MVEMHLSAVRVEYPTNTPILLLQEATGDRALPIYIGRPEAEAIATALQGVVTKRPMTHDLMRDVLTEVGLVLDHVVITELKDQTFYAELRLRRGGRHRPGHQGRCHDLCRGGAARRRRDRHSPARGHRRTGRGRRAGGPVPRVHRRGPA